MDDLHTAPVLPFLRHEGHSPLDERSLRRALEACGGRDVLFPFRGEELPRVPERPGLRCWLQPLDEAAACALQGLPPRPDGIYAVASAARLPSHGLRAWLRPMEDRAPLPEGLPPPLARFVEGANWQALMKQVPPVEGGEDVVVALASADDDPTGPALALASRGMAFQARALVWPGPLETAGRRLRQLLNALELRPHGVHLVSCPTCGRCRVDLASVARAVDAALWDVKKPLSVAVMGCAVNGPGEARHAHCGLAGGRGGGVLFRGGELLRRVEEKDMVDALVAEVRRLEEDEAVQGLAPRPWPAVPTGPRRRSRQVFVGGLPLGGGAPLVLQSMCNTDSADAPATLAQIRALVAGGCQLVRLAIPDEGAAEALPQILRQSPCPLVADIHFSTRLAMASLEAGIHKLRVNPGNLGGLDKARPVLLEARRRGVPIRIGVNGGSLDRDLLSRHGAPTPEAMVESAMAWIDALSEMGVLDLVLSLKSSSVQDTLLAHRLLAAQTDCPLHVGITEAGFGEAGQIKSVVGVGLLLLEGLGDTLRISLTGDPLDELPVARELLRVLDGCEG